LSINSNKDVPVPQAILERLIAVDFQVVGIVVEQVLQKVEILERFVDGTQHKLNPIRMIFILVVLIQ